MDVINKAKILLVGASTKSAIYVAKQYKLYGLHVSIVDWHNVPINKSKYIDVYYNIGSPIDDLTAFASNLINLIRKEKFECILPIHDPAVQVCQKYYTAISELTKIIGLNIENIQSYATDKWKLLELSKLIGLKIPKSHLITNTEDLKFIISNITFPCVIKPISSSVIINNKVLELAVRFANNEHELIDIIREYVNVVNLIIQEYLEGYGIGYNIISKKGIILNQYIHCRLNENHGVSTYRKTLPIDTFSLRHYIEKFINHIQWNGVAMIEFRISNGIPYLMEMNGRFWGSIELGIKSGLNYPVQLYETQVLNKAVACDISYKLIKVRNLHDEILYYSSALFNRKVISFIKWLYNLIIERKNSFIEDSIFDDTFFVLSIYLNDIKRIINKRLNMFRIINRKIFSLSNNIDKKIAFVCAGNICRSPFAEKYAALKFKNYKFTSFGTVPMENRMSPMNAVRASEYFQIDLNTSLSKTFNNEIKENIDIFVVMDKSNYKDLLDRGIEKRAIFFLSEKDIPDPYKQDLRFFQSTYTEIANQLDKLSETII